MNYRTNSRHRTWLLPLAAICATAGLVCALVGHADSNTLLVGWACWAGALGVLMVGRRWLDQ